MVILCYGDIYSMMILRVLGSPVGLGTQITADFPQPHAFGLLQLRAFGSRKMLAYARRPPNCGGLYADKERMNLGVFVRR